MDIYGAEVMTLHMVLVVFSKCLYSNDCSTCFRGLVFPDIVMIYILLLLNSVGTDKPILVDIAVKRHNCNYKRKENDDDLLKLI